MYATPPPLPRPRFSPLDFALRRMTLRRRDLPLGLGAVALLVLLAGAARAGIVASNLFSGDAGGVAIAAVRGPRGTRLLQFALLLALKFPLQFVDSGRWRTGWDGHGLAGGGRAIAGLSIAADVHRQAPRAGGRRRGERPGVGGAGRVL